MFLYSVHYLTNALRIQHMTYIRVNSYMFRHRGVIIRELLQRRCTSLPANTCFVHPYKYNYNVGLLKYIKLIVIIINSVLVL
jgi:hypothetical protein